MFPLSIDNVLETVFIRIHSDILLVEVTISQYIIGSDQLYSFSPTIPTTFHKYIVNVVLLIMFQSIYHFESHTLFTLITEIIL